MGRAVAQIVVFEEKNAVYFRYFVHHAIMCVLLAGCLWHPCLSVCTRFYIFFLAQLLPSMWVPGFNMQHTLSHLYSVKTKHVFRADWMHFVIEYVFDPLMLRYHGGLFHNQHIHQHHRFNNSEADPQTLMFFRRNSMTNSVWFVVGELMNHFLRLPWFHLSRRSGCFTNAFVNQVVWFALHPGVLMMSSSWSFSAFILWHSYSEFAFLAIFVVEFAQHGLIDPSRPND